MRASERQRSSRWRWQSSSDGLLALLAAIVLALATPAGAGGLAVHVLEPSVGGVVVVRVEAEAAEGTFDGKPLHFVRAGKESIALLGIDLERKAGRGPLRITAGGERVVRELRIQPKRFPEERLKVSKSYTDLDRETLLRVTREQKLLSTLWPGSSREKLWQGSFVKPADGPAGSPFGMRRFFNGEARSPHAGIDYRSPLGAPVRASNAGRVVLAGELFFTGNTVVVDHGLDVFTLYVHLSKTDVAAGDRVTRGQEIGKVGATGRVTGPHLHFATRIGSARVDPAALLALDLP